MCQPISKVIPSRLNLSQVVLIIRNIRSDDVYKSLIVSFFCNIICNPFFTDFDGMIAILKTKCEFKLLNEYILRNQTNSYDDNTTITSEIYDYTKEILKEMEIETVRLIGVRLDNLVTNNDYQVSLFDSFSKKTTDEKFDNVIDKLKDKYGNKIITKASLKDVNNIKKDIG